MTSWLVHSSQDRAVRVRALAGDNGLSSLVRLFTLTVSFSTQLYKWVPANLMLGGGGGGVTLRWPGLSFNPGGSRNTHGRFMLQQSEISTTGLRSHVVSMQSSP